MRSWHHRSAMRRTETEFGHLNLTSLRSEYPNSLPFGRNTGTVLIATRESIRRRLYTIATDLITITASPSVTTPSMEYRLPTDVSPTHYNLTLLTDLSQHKFRGAVEIDLKVNAETSKLVLNTADLQLSEVSVTIPGGEEAFVPVSQSTDKINQRATFVFPNTFATDVSLRLFIMFEGQLGGNLIGYYEGTWEAEGKKNFYTVTQFEVTILFVLSRSAF